MTTSENPPTSMHGTVALSFCCHHFRTKLLFTITSYVSTASYVYIYAGQAANQARRASQVSSAGDALKIYGIALNKSTTGIEAIDNGKLTNDNAVSRLQNGIFTLTGVKVSDDAADLKTLKHGIYIVNGRKVAVK